MPSKLSTTVSKIATIPNPVNSILITEFHKYMEISGASERHQNNSLKMVMAFAFFIGKDVTLYNVNRKDQICSFLDTKIKNQEQDPDKRWITTWNYYLVHLKRFFRWLHNYYKPKCAVVGVVAILKLNYN
jgi:integrase/recombinase XerD